MIRWLPSKYLRPSPTDTAESFSYIFNTELTVTKEINEMALANVKTYFKWPSSDLIQD